MRSTATKRTISSKSLISVITAKPPSDVSAGLAAEAKSDAGHSIIPACSRDDLAALTVDDRGMVCDCNRAGEALFKYRRSELVWGPVSNLLPQLADFALIQNGEPNQRLKFLCHIGLYFMAVTKEGEHFSSELFLNCLDSKRNSRLSLIVRPVFQVMTGLPLSGS